MKRTSQMKSATKKPTTSREGGTNQLKTSPRSDKTKVAMRRRKLRTGKSASGHDDKDEPSDSHGLRSNTSFFLGSGALIGV